MGLCSSGCWFWFQNGAVDCWGTEMDYGATISSFRSRSLLFSCVLLLMNEWASVKKFPRAQVTKYVLYLRSRYWNCCFRNSHKAHNEPRTISNARKYIEPSQRAVSIGIYRIKHFLCVIGRCTSSRVQAKLSTAPRICLRVRSATVRV